jgi:hypothetical protein
VSWGITVIDARGCEVAQSGACTAPLDVPAWITSANPACFTDPDFLLTLSNDYDFAFGDITIAKAPSSSTPGNNNETIDAAVAFPDEVFNIQAGQDRIRVNPDLLIGEDIRYAGLYNITLTIPPDESTNCEELTVTTQVTLFPSLEPCFDLPNTEYCADGAAFDVEVSTSPENTGWDQLGNIMGINRNEMSVWRLTTPDGTVVEEEEAGLDGQADGGVKLDIPALVTAYGTGTYTLNHELGIDICQASCSQTFQIVDPVVEAVNDITVCPGGTVDDIFLFAIPFDDENEFTWSEAPSNPGTLGLPIVGGTNTGENPYIPSFTATDQTGTYTVEVFVTTPEGCVSDTVTFDIIVSDDPQLSFVNCPVFNPMKPNDAGQCNAEVTWEDPELVNLGDCTPATDIDVEITVSAGVTNCDPVAFTYNPGTSRTCTFPVGTHTITYTTDYDDDGTFGEDPEDVVCSFEIIVMDEEAPMITCPDNQVFDTDPDECDATWTIDGSEVTVSDNCASPPSTQWTIEFPDGSTDSGSGLPGSQDFPAGVSEVTIKVTDGNFAGMGTPLGNATVSWNFDGSSLVSATTDNTLATGDNAVYGSGVGNQNFFNGNPSSGDAIAGNNWQEASATDAFNNGDYFEFTINADPGAELTINSIGFEDDASGTGPSNWAIFVDGSQEGSGATAEDFDPPSPHSISTSNTVPAGGSAVVRIAAWGASFSTGTWRIDNVSIAVSGAGPAMAASGNTNECSFTVTVNDNQAPTVPCTSTNPMALDCGDPLPPALAIGTNVGEINATDNCTAQDDLILTVSDISNETSYCDVTNPLQIVRTYTFIDEANNSTECVQTFTYNANTPPSITNQPAAPADCFTCVNDQLPDALFDYLESLGGATASDDCSDVTWSNDFDINTAQALCAIGGTLDVIFTATDECGASTDANPVTICIDVNPVIGIAKNASNLTDNGDGTYTVDYLLTLENLGDVILDGIQVSDDLVTVFGTYVSTVGDVDAINEYTITNLSIVNNSTTPLVLGSGGATFNGDGIQAILDGATGEMLPGEVVQIGFTLTFFPDLTTNPQNFQNVAVADATAPDGTGVTDNSEEGLDPDPNNNGDPSDGGAEDTPTTITIGEMPAIGLAKESDEPVDLGNGLYEITYRLKIENLGTTQLGDIQIEDILDGDYGTFVPGTPAPGQYTVNDPVVLIDPNTIGNALTVNTGYTGSGSTGDATVELFVVNQNSVLNQGEVAIVEFTVTFFPQLGGGMNSITLNNTAVVTADEPDSIDGASDGDVTDTSDDGTETDTDGDNNGNEAGENDETVDVISIDPEIGLAKTSSGFTDNGDGTYTITYTLTIENLSTSVDLGDIQVRDNLSDPIPTGAGFGEHNATATVKEDLSKGEYFISGLPVITNNSSDPLFPSNLFTGVPGNLVLLFPGQGGVMEPGEVVTLEYEVTVFPDLANGTFMVDNQAFVFADAPALDDPVGVADNNASDASTTDLSDNGTEPDANNNGDAGDMGEDDPTPDEIEIESVIGVSKLSSGFTNNNDGTYDVTYTIEIKNLGNTRLHDIQAVEDLNAANFGDFQSGIDIADLDVGEYQIIVGPTLINNTPGVDAELTLNAGYNGDGTLAGPTELLFSTLQGGYIDPGFSAVIEMTVRIFPDFATNGTSATTYQVNNQVLVGGDAPNMDDDETMGEFDNDVTDASTNDFSDDENIDGNGNGDPTDAGENDPTIDNITIDPSIGVAKSSNGFTDNGDGTYSITYTVTVENLSTSIDLGDIQVTDNLAAAIPTGAGFGTWNSTATMQSDLAPTEYFISAGPVIVNNAGMVDPLSPNANFDGSGDLNLLDVAAGGILEPGEKAVIEFEVTVFPDEDNGTFAVENQVQALGDTPDNDDGVADGNVTDLSDNGNDTDANNNGDAGDMGEDDPTPDEIEIESVIGVSKLSSGFTNNQDGTFDITYTIEIKNLGNTRLHDIQAVEDLNAANFGDFQSGIDIADLDVGEYQIIVGPTLINNTPGVDAELTLNAGYNGDGTLAGPTELLFSTLQGGYIDPGFSAVIEMTVRIFPDFATNGTSATTYEVNNQVLVGGDAPNMDDDETMGEFDNDVTDASTNDFSDDENIDGNGNGDPTDAGEDDPTMDNIVIDPQIGIAKAADPVIDNDNGTYTINYTFVIENLGTTVDLGDIQVTDQLDNSLGGAGFGTTFVGSDPADVDMMGEYAIENLSIAVNSSQGLFINDTYDGITDLEFFDVEDGGVIAVGEQVIVEMTVTWFPAQTTGTVTISNQATATADKPENDDPTGQEDQDATDDTSDTSDDGIETDPNQNGDPGDPGEDDPTVSSFPIDPVIGVSKRVSQGPINNGDGSFDVTFEIRVENFGNQRLSNLQVIENLSSTFASAASWEVLSLQTDDFTANLNFNGVGDQQLLTGTDTLFANTAGAIYLEVRVVPGANLTGYTNVVQAFGTPPSGVEVSDNSVNGSDPDPNNDGNPDEMSPTPIEFEEDARIGVAKRVSDGPINNGDGSYDLTFEIRVENFGDVGLGDLQVTEDLAGTFANADDFEVLILESEEFTVNTAFDGDGDTDLLTGIDTLEAGNDGAIYLTVRVVPGDVLTGYENTVVATGTPPTGTAISDTSTDGSDPDPNNDGNPEEMVPTPIDFEEDARIGVAKRVSDGPINNGDGSYDLTFEIRVENFGDVGLGDLQVTEDLAGTFANADDFEVLILESEEFTVNTAFDGDGDTDLLTGIDTLEAGNDGAIYLTVRVVPGDVLTGYENTVVATGTPPTGTAISDTSTDGSDPDPNNDGNPEEMVPTPIDFEEDARIGVAKRVSDGPINNGDGSYDLTFEIRVENFGDVGLGDLQVTEDLAGTFANADDFEVLILESEEFTVNTAFDGDNDTDLLTGIDTLEAGNDGAIYLTVRVVPGDVLTGYENTVVATGTPPTGTAISDTSTDGSDPDPNNDGNPEEMVPTPIDFEEDARIGVAKRVSDGPINNGDGSYDLTFEIRVENFGDVGLGDLQVTEDLAGTFANADDFEVLILESEEFTVNTAFDGDNDTDLLTGIDTLEAGNDGAIYLTVRVVPGDVLTGYENTVVATGTPPTGTAISDTSTDGSDPDPNNDGNPEEMVPTPIDFEEDARIGVAKRVSDGPINNGDGSYDLTFEIRVENFGDVGLGDLQVTEDLAGTFANADDFEVLILESEEFTVNTAFDGDNDTDLLTGIDTLEAGNDGAIYLTVRVVPGDVLTGYENTVVATGTPPTGTAISDTSTDGSDPDPNNDGNPEEMVPTPIDFEEDARIGVAKRVSDGPINNGDGSYDLTFEIRVENFGDVGLGDLQVTEDLAGTFANADDFEVLILESEEFTVNTAFDGDNDTDLLTGIDTLEAGNDGAIYLTVRVVPGDVLTGYENTVVATGTPPTGTAISDTSTDGSDPDPNNDGNPEEMVPTPIDFEEDARIGVAKRVSDGPINNGDGSYDLTFEIRVENFGDVGLGDLQVTEDLAFTFR